MQPDGAACPHACCAPHPATASCRSELAFLERYRRESEVRERLRFLRAGNHLLERESRFLQLAKSLIRVRHVDEHCSLRGADTAAR